MKHFPRRQPDRLPPYSDQVKVTVRTVFVSAGPDAWRRARRWRSEGTPGLVCDPREPPNTYEWPVHGRMVALIALDLERSRVIQLCEELVDAGATVIAVLHGSEPDKTLVDLVVPRKMGRP